MEQAARRYSRVASLLGAGKGFRGMFLRTTGVGAALLVIGMVFYLSWIPDPRFGNLGWLPAWLSDWADEYGRLRTAVPFLPLGLLAGSALYFGQRKKADWAWTLLALTGVVTIAELGQILLPKRVADWRDIVCGAMGSAAGMGAVAVYGLWKRKNAREIS